MTENKPFSVTVSQLNRRIALMLKGDKTLSGLSVRGELSNVKPHTSGHLYFTLRDETSAVRGVMFRSYADQLTFRPEEGMSVTVTGNVQCFERDGVYQLYASEIVPSGAGEQAVAQKQLKERLYKEGVFSRKRPLPRFPEKICVITAETGAALQDILNILGRRCPTVRVILIPAAVQGEKAPESICRAFARANETDADTIIFGRGGGSAEDLSAFDTEQVARAVYGSRIPTISAVGHETDVCIADLAADLRAPTPSAAAELAVPDVFGLIASLEGRLTAVKKSFSALLSARERSVERVFSAIAANSPRSRLLTNERLLDVKRIEIQSRMRRLLSEREHRLSERVAVLSALNPLAVLTRGYSIVYKGDEAVTSAASLSVGDEVLIRLSEGSVSARISAVGADERPAESENSLKKSRGKGAKED